MSGVQWWSGNQVLARLTSVLHPAYTYFSLEGDAEGLGILLLLLEFDIRRLNGDGHAKLGLLL